MEISPRSHQFIAVIVLTDLYMYEDAAADCSLEARSASPSHTRRIRMNMRIVGTRRLLSSVRSGSPLPQLPTTSFYSFLRAHGEFAKHADLPAITCASSGRTLTYGELDRRVGSASRALARTGFAKGSVLSVHLPNCEQLVVAFFAATELGGVVTASNPAYTVAELAAQQSGARASAVISSSSLRDVVIAAAAESMKKIGATHKNKVRRSTRGR